MTSAGVLDWLKSWARAGLRRAGLDVVRYEGRRTFRGALRHIRERGFEPSTVIDVGVGGGTPDLYDVFGDAALVLVEPLEEFESDLQRIRDSYDAHVVPGVATETEGEAELNVHHKLEGSSLYREAEGRHVDGISRAVPAVTVDGIFRELGLEGPVLIKIDVQGAELDVLQGATHVLERTEYVMLEASLFKFFRGGPVVLDVLEFMNERGFALYDIHRGHYRPLDGALAQVDLAFVKKEGRFRESHHYASREQRRTIESGQ